MENTVAVILAGGGGKRLRPLTEETPKPLLEIAGKTMLEHAIDVVKAAGISETIVVAGHKSEVMEAWLQKFDPSIKVFVADPQFQNLDGFALTLEAVKDKSLFVLNADYVFTEENLKKTAEGMQQDIVAFCSYDLSGDDDDVMVVKEDADGNIIDMSKTLTDFESIYTGMFFIPMPQAEKLEGIVRKLQQELDPKEASAEQILLAYGPEGEAVKVANVGHANWFEVDTIEELEAAKAALE